MTTSGLRIRESCFTRTTSPEAEQAPDADRDGSTISDGAMSGISA